MIIKRGVKVQLLVFLVITALSMAYTAVNIVGIGQQVLDLRYTVYVDLADSGGIFTNAEVTYRGVTVGRVGPLKLTDDGVRVELRIDQGEKIPDNDTQAYVLNRSAVGEQYVDLRPAGGGPPLRDGDVIPKSDTHLPVPTAELLRNVDALLKSVNSKDLATILDEIDKGLAGEGPDLQALLDSSKKVLDGLEASYPDTVALLKNGKTVLDTQNAEAGAFREFSHNLAAFSTALRKSDGDLRGLLDAFPGAIDQASDLLDGLEPTLPVLLANGSVIGKVLTSRIPGIRQMLIVYPLLTAGVHTATPGDGTVHFGLELNLNNPPPCTKGYESTKIRYPQDISPAPINKKAGCREPKNSPTGVRGARNAPEPNPYPTLPPGATSGAGFPNDAKTDTDEKPSLLARGSPGKKHATSRKSGFGLQTTYVTGYDPRTRVFVGPDGKRYHLGKTSQLTGDSSWQTLLFSPILG